MHELDGFSILLVDDHPLFREGMTLALSQRAEGLKVHAVSTVAEAERVLQEGGVEFDLALFDHRMPDEDGLSCAIRLRARFPNVAFALMSGTDENALPARAAKAGLAGFFPKTLEVEHLLAGLQALARGETFFREPSMSNSSTQLTPRQLDIVRLAARGAGNKEIAEALGITPHTVRNHLTQIFERLGARNRAQAVSMAYDFNDE